MDFDVGALEQHAHDLRRVVPDGDIQRTLALQYIARNRAIGIRKLRITFDVNTETEAETQQSKTWYVDM